MSDPLTSKQQKARAYYHQNKERFIENARRWREEHPEQMRQYQAEYFQRYKFTDAYQRSLERRKQAHYKEKATRPPKVKPLRQPQPDPIPLFQLYRPPIPPPEPEQPTSFAVTFS